MRNFQRTILPVIILGFFCSKDARSQSLVDKWLSHQVTVHYPDHTVIAVVKPTGSVAIQSNATYYWCSGNQINVTQGGYSGKLLNGNYQDFYLNKNLKETGAFKHGLKTGIWKSWTDTGILKDQYAYQNGRKKGAYIKYDASGKLLEKGNYKQGFLSGTQITMIGDSAVVVYYHQGKIRPKKNLVPRFIRDVFINKK